MAEREREDIHPKLTINRKVRASIFSAAGGFEE
jgi:hypothetical protein